MFFIDITNKGRPARNPVEHNTDSGTHYDFYFVFYDRPIQDNPNDIITFFVQGIHSDTLSPPPRPVPEPSTFALLAIGGIALVGYGWRRKRQQAV